MKIFNRLKHMFFGDKEVLKTDEVDGRIVVTFKDETTETMTKEEWEAGKSEKIMSTPAELQEALIKRSVPVALAVQKTLMDFNPRYFETKVFIQRVLDGVEFALNEAKSRLFGVKSFNADVNVDMILKKLEDAGQDPYEGLSDREKSFIKLFREVDLKVWEIESGNAFINITAKVMQLMDKAMELAMGVKGNTLRVDDIEKILKEYAPKEATIVPSGDPAGSEQTAEAPSKPVSEDSGSVEAKSASGEQEKSA